MPKVFISTLIPSAGIERLEKSCELIIWDSHLPPSKEDYLERIQDCDAAITMLDHKIDREILASAPKLKVISNFAMGLDNIDLVAAKKLGILVGNTPGTLTETTAELALALLLTLSRRILPACKNAQDGQWNRWEPNEFLGIDLAGKTLGIVGMGKIGTEFARICHDGLKMEVIYTSRTDKGRYHRVEQEELLRSSDIVSVHCALTEQTRKLFDADMFGKMKKGALFLNTARGAICDEKCLYDSLKSGHLGGAALDVTDPEPMEHSNPLLALSNVVITPHIGSATLATRSKMAILAAENILAGLKGDELPCYKMD